MDSKNIVFLELNELSEFFMRKYAGEGILPHFSNLLASGSLSHTYIPSENSKDPDYRRNISPWIIWPSVYTGLLPEQHKLVGFGQNTGHLKGRFIWDVLNSAGVSCGIFGCLMSFPPRGDLDFYIPESLADEPNCFPESLESLQKLFLLGAHNYSNSFLGSSLRALSYLVGALKNGMSVQTAARAVFQEPMEWFFGGHLRSERALLHSYMSFDVFKNLYQSTMPRFSALHLNHIAYMQHRFWRAAEPQLFSRDLSSTDRRFFSSKADRDEYEQKNRDWIKRAFVWTDQMIGQLIKLMPHEGVLMVASGLGQRPYDPVGEIHNPVARLARAEDLFAKIGLDNFHILYQMNPDITINFLNRESATIARTKIEKLYIVRDQPMFNINQSHHQLFLELIVPVEFERDSNLDINHIEIQELVVPARRHIWLSSDNEQSTGHHDGEGILITWRKNGEESLTHNRLGVDSIAPLILKEFGLPPCSWHRIPSIN